MTFARLNASWTMTGGIFVLNVVQPTKIWHDFLSAFWVIQAQPILKSQKVHKKTGQLPGMTLIPSGHNSVNYKKKKSQTRVAFLRNSRVTTPTCVSLHSTWTLDDKRQKRNAFSLP